MPSPYSQTPLDIRADIVSMERAWELFADSYAKVRTPRDSYEDIDFDTLVATPLPSPDCDGYGQIDEDNSRYVTGVRRFSGLLAVTMMQIGHDVELRMPGYVTTSPYDGKTRHPRHSFSPRYGELEKSIVLQAAGRTTMQGSLLKVVLDTARSNNVDHVSAYEASKMLLIHWSDPAKVIEIITKWQEAKDSVLYSALLRDIYELAPDGEVDPEMGYDDAELKRLDVTTMKAIVLKEQGVKAIGPEEATGLMIAHIKEVAESTID